MSKSGLIIGFANEQRKRVLESYNHLSKDKDNGFIIQKANGFISNNKDGMQREIIEIVRQYSTINTIYIVLTFDRIDMMKRHLSLIMNHFKYYVNNIYLIVANFQKSQDKIKDQEVIQRELQDQYNLKNNFLYLFGQNYRLDVIHSHFKEIKSEDIISYFTTTICDTIMLDDMKMDLYPKINTALQNQIREYINRSESSLMNLQIPSQQKNVYIAKNYKLERLQIKSNQQNLQQSKQKYRSENLFPKDTRQMFKNTKRQRFLLKNSKYINFKFSFPWKKQSCKNIIDLESPLQAHNQETDQIINLQKPKKTLDKKKSLQFRTIMNIDQLGNFVDQTKKDQQLEIIGFQVNK
ncbi:hypothetical protein pb186bvf_016451 [Paramecium bursaria]